MDVDGPIGPDVDDDIETLTALGSALISAILDQEPFESIKAIIEAGAPLWYQDEVEGLSPLHAAAYAGSDDELVKLLIEEGAVWNAGNYSLLLLVQFFFVTADLHIFIFIVDNLQNTAGDIALSFNNEACYNIIRDAGIRSGTVIFAASFSSFIDSAKQELLLTLLASRATPQQPSSLVLKTTDLTATGSTDAFLSSRLRFTTDAHGQEICLLQTGSDEVGVMMGWEKGISQLFCHYITGP